MCHPKSSRHWQILVPETRYLFFFQFECLQLTDLPIHIRFDMMVFCLIDAVTGASGWHCCEIGDTRTEREVYCTQPTDKTAEKHKVYLNSLFIILKMSLSRNPVGKLAQDLPTCHEYQSNTFCLCDKVCRVKISNEWKVYVKFSQGLIFISLGKRELSTKSVQFATSTLSTSLEVGARNDPFLSW